MGREHQFDGSPGSLGSDPLGLAGVLEDSAKAVAVDPALESDDSLMAAAVALEVARENLEAAHVRVLAHLESTGATDAEVGMRTGSWLAWETDTNRSRCRQRVAMARRLAWLDQFCGALADGTVRFRHCEVLASVLNRRNRDALRIAQTVIIEWAQRFDFEQWAEMVRQLASDLDLDGAFDPNEDPSSNRVRLRDNRDGTVDIAGVLNGATAVTVTQGLEALADELFRRYSVDSESDPDLVMPSRCQLLAEAMAEMVRRATAVDINSTRPPRTEAVIVIEERATDPDRSSGPEGGSGGTSTDDHTAEPFHGDDHTEPQLLIHDLHGRVVPSSAVGTLLVDADLRALLLSDSGDPLWMGTKVRLATPAQKQALAVRDGGCIFPGCDMPPEWCDAHHQPAWKPAGRTDIDKMYLACRHHHGVTHRRGWSCAPDPDRPQHWIWTTPSGRTLHSRRQHRRPG